MPTTADTKFHPRTLTCSLSKHPQQSSMDILMPASRQQLRQLLSHHLVSCTIRYPTPARTLLAAENRRPVPVARPGQLLPPTVALPGQLAPSVDPSRKARALTAAQSDPIAARANFGALVASVLLPTAHRRRFIRRG